MSGHDGTTTAAGLTRRGVELTGKERLVLAQLATHRTYAAIAHELMVSVNTVKSHVLHIYSKLGATTRAEAVQQAIQLGLITARQPRLNDGAAHSPTASWIERAHLAITRAKTLHAKTTALQQDITRRWGIH